VLPPTKPSQADRASTFHVSARRSTTETQFQQ
jgi:hypothetical protein